MAFNSEVVLQVREMDSKTLTDLRVVSYNGNSPTLVKQSFYKKDGELKFGKTKSISLADFQYILKNKNKILKALS